MPIGKPNFNLNSFGVKYLSKDEIQEFIDKREGESIGTKTELGDAKQMTSRGTTSGRTNVQSESSTSGIESRPHPKLFGQHRESIGGKEIGRKFSEKKPTSAKPTKDTTSVFNSPSYGVTERMKKPKTTDPSEGKNPPKYEPIGTSSTDKLVTSKPNEKETRGGAVNEGISMPNKLGDAPKDVKGKETKIGQKKVRVGVGEKAHEKLQETGGVGDKRYAADRKSPHSEASERKRERESTQSKKLGAAQSKVHELKRRRDIETLGTAKKSDDIILDMNILKLDLSKMDYNTAGQYPHVKGTSGYKDPKKKLPTAPKDDPRRLDARFDESHNISEDEKT